MAKKGFFYSKILLILVIVASSVVSVISCSDDSPVAEEKQEQININAEMSAMNTEYDDLKESYDKLKSDISETITNLSEGIYADELIDLEKRQKELKDSQTKLLDKIKSLKTKISGKTVIGDFSAFDVSSLQQKVQTLKNDTDVLANDLVKIKEGNEKINAEKSKAQDLQRKVETLKTEGQHLLNQYNEYKMQSERSEPVESG